MLSGQKKLEYMHEYNQRPEVRARDKAWRQQPEVKARHKARRQRRGYTDSYIDYLCSLEDSG